jgi:hypothetical protein
VGGRYECAVQRRFAAFFLFLWAVGAAAVVQHTWPVSVGAEELTLDTAPAAGGDAVDAPLDLSGDEPGAALGWASGCLPAPTWLQRL